MNISSRDYNLLFSHNKKVRMTVKLFDSETYEEIENITGSIISASFDKSYDSDIRSVCSLTINVPNKNKLYYDFEKTWNKQMVELYCGIYDFDNKEWVDYSLGRMLMESGSYTYDATNQQIKLNLVDLMASLTESRGSQIGSDTHIPATTSGVSVKNVIEAIINEFAEFKRSSVCEFEDSLPYDLDFDSGIYPIEMLKKILDLFPYYEMFYDENGIFTVQKIPTMIDDPVDIEANVLDPCIISESKDNNFTNIKNTTEIWGQELTCDYAAITCTQNESTYNVYIDSSVTGVYNGETYAVVPNANSVADQKMNIQDYGSYFIYTMNGSGVYSKIEANEMKSGVAYCIRYNDEKFILVGELQIRCIVQEITEMPSSEAQQYYKDKNNCLNVEWVVNPNSTYACTISQTTGRINGEIKQVLSGGEYESISSTQLAYERAKYENWLKCRLQDKINIETILIPWINVNQKIEYTSPVSGDVETWIVQSVSFNFDNWTMDITASRFYPYYPW